MLISKKKVITPLTAARDASQRRLLEVSPITSRSFSRHFRRLTAFALRHKILTRATFGPRAALSRPEGQVFDTPVLYKFEDLFCPVLFPSGQNIFSFLFLKINFFKVSFSCFLLLSNHSGNHRLLPPPPPQHKFVTARSIAFKIVCHIRLL